MVDPVDAFLRHDAVHGLVERPGGGEIAAERLLDNDRCSPVKARVLELTENRLEGGRGHGQVDDPAGQAQQLGQGRPGVALRRHVPQALSELREGSLIDLAAPEFGHRGAGELAKAGVVEVPGGGADNDAPTWQDALPAQFVQRRQQLATR